MANVFIIQLERSDQTSERSERTSRVSEANGNNKGVYYIHVYICSEFASLTTVLYIYTYKMCSDCSLRSLRWIIYTFIYIKYGIIARDWRPLASLARLVLIVSLRSPLASLAHLVLMVLVRMSFPNALLAWWSFLYLPWRCSSRPNAFSINTCGWLWLSLSTFDGAFSLLGSLSADAIL